MFTAHPAVRIGLFIVALLLAAPTAWAQTQQVMLKDGRTIVGDVTESETSVTVKTAQGEQSFPKDQVLRISEFDSPKQAYLQRKAQIDDQDARALYALADWVWKTYPENLELLTFAREDLQQAIQINRDFTRAKLLQRQVAAKIETLRAGGAEPSPPDQAPLPAAQAGDLLDRRGILWVRLMELRPSDRLRIVYENRALNRYIDDMRGQSIDNWDRRGKENYFRSLPRARQVQEILVNKKDDIGLLKDIHVMQDPQFMLEFRSRIWPIIQRGCAAATCHGGSRPRGGLKFYSDAAGRSERVDYTNFVIVSGFKAGQRRLIDRQSPEDSLLLQYGLNADISKYDHPGEIPQLFRSKRDRNYQRVLNWIRSLQGPMHPDYHLDWKPPFGMNIDTSGAPDIPMGQ